MCVCVWVGECWEMGGGDAWEAPSPKADAGWGFPLTSKWPERHLANLFEPTEQPRLAEDP